MGRFGVSETLNFEVPQFVRTLRVVTLVFLLTPLRGLYYRKPYGTVCVGTEFLNPVANTQKMEV